MRAIQSKMARAALGLTVKQLAEKSGVSHDTIVRFEGGQELKPRTIAAIRAALEAAGAELTRDGGVRLRATSSPAPERPEPRPAPDPGPEDDVE